MENVMKNCVVSPGFVEYYNDLRSDCNNMSFWYPQIQKVEDRKHLLIPKTVIKQVPPEITELFFMEKKGMTQIEMMEHVYNWIKNSFYPSAKSVIPGPLWFIKNGNFSNKYEFNRCMCHSDDLMEITSNVININYNALCLGANGSTELIAREFIEAPRDTPTIYSNMPLRCEVRVFYDFDNRKTVYAANYWDWDYCHKSISRNPTDKIVYEAVYPRIEKRFQEIHGFAMELVEKALANVTGLDGIWSVDLMDVGNHKFFLIDMAIGARSAYWDKDRIDKYLNEVQK